MKYLTSENYINFGGRMKIAVESNDGITIKSPFSRARGYLVYNVDDTHITGYEYRAAEDADERINSARLPFSDCNAVISRGMDRTNQKSLKDKGIDVFITFNTSARDALRVYIKENLINTRIVH